MDRTPGILAGAALLCTCSSSCDGRSERARFELGRAVIDPLSGDVTVEAYAPPFYFETDTAALAAEARAAIGRPLHVSGCIVQEQAPYNDPHWLFMFVSIYGFEEVSAEACDANIAETNADWPSYFAGAPPCDGGAVQLCSWESRVLAEVE